MTKVATSSKTLLPRDLGRKISQAKNTTASGQAIARFQ